MTTIDHEPQEPAADAKPATSNRTRNGLIAAGLAVLLVGGAGYAWASDAARDFRDARAAVHFVGWGGGGGPVGHMLDEIDATDEQSDRIDDLMDEARDEARPMMREFRDARGKALELLSAPTIDRAAIETLRAERVAAIDQASKQMMDKLVQAAEVLTPKQRTELAEVIKERAEKGPGKRHWR